MKNGGKHYEWIKEVFGTEKPIVAMCHLQAMPGDPYYDKGKGMKDVLDKARHDLLALQNGGVDAVMFSNEFSLPYLTKVKTETVASMARIIGELKDEIEVPYGVNCLWDPIASLDLAVATEAKFVREIFTGVYASDFGLWDTNCGEVVRHQREIGAENVFDFSLGNPSIVPPKSVKESIIDIVNTEPEMELHGYMNNSGYEDVREAIAEFTNKSYGTNFTKANIVMTVGAAGGINVTFKTLVDEGDEIICIAPYFGEYNSYISNANGVRVVVSPDTETFSINFKELEEKISPKTKFVIINSPNNPTGAVYSEEDIKKLASILEKKQAEYGTEIYIFSDEPYREIAFNNTEVPYVTKYYNNTIVGYSYSKSLSLPGERIGYLVVPNEIADFEDVNEWS